jgi:hypothetical protein
MHIDRSTPHGSAIHRPLVCLLLFFSPAQQCGQLRDTDVELMGPEEGVTEPFTLPPLTLIKPDDVLGDAITDVRQVRALHSREGMIEYSRGSSIRTPWG